MNRDQSTSSFYINQSTDQWVTVVVTWRVTWRLQRFILLMSNRTSELTLRLSTETVNDNSIHHHHRQTDRQTEITSSRSYLVRRIIRCGMAPIIRSIIARCSRLSWVYTHHSLSYFQFHSQLANLANVSIHRQSVDYMHTSGGEIFRLCTSWTSVTWTLDPVIQHMYHSCTSMYTSNFGKTLWMDGHWDRL